MDDLQANPVLVDVSRGGTVESSHRGAAVVMDPAGGVVAAWGNVDRPVYPRSAVKPLQALLLIESGAADQFSLGDAEIALATSSHSGEPEHVALVTAWLERLGLGAGDLECGPHAPIDDGAAADLSRAGGQPSALHKNCSGKHTGFLTTALHLGEETRGYVKPGHPVQRRMAEVLSDMGGLDLKDAPRGTDGCGIPVIAMPLSAMALGMARLANPDGLSPARAAACRRVFAAMAGHGRLVAGRGRFDTLANEAGGGAFVVKDRSRGGLRRRHGRLRRRPEDRRRGQAGVGDGHGRHPRSLGRPGRHRGPGWVSRRRRSQLPRRGGRSRPPGPGVAWLA